MKFSEVITRSDPDLVVSKRHEAWITANSDLAYSDEALAFAGRELGKVQRVRKDTVSASSLGSCLRQQQFTYLGMPQLPPTAQSAARMHTGTFMHLRWQMEGLTEGWLAQAEVPVSSDEHKLHGTMDGILYDGSILELKSTNSHGFSGINAFGPRNAHLFQMATYMLCTGLTKGVFIYENKDNQEYNEVVVTEEDVPLLGARLRVESMWTAIEKKSLFEPLEKCIDKTGWEYNYCPFKDRCLAIHEWDEAGDGHS